MVNNILQLDSCCHRISDQLRQSDALDRLVTIFANDLNFYVYDRLNNSIEVDISECIEHFEELRRMSWRLMALSIAYLKKAYRAKVINHRNVDKRSRVLISAHYHIYSKTDEEDLLLDSVSNYSHSAILQPVSGRWSIF